MSPRDPPISSFPVPASYMRTKDPISHSHAWAKSHLPTDPFPCPPEYLVRDMGHFPTRLDDETLMCLMEKIM